MKHKQKAFQLQLDGTKVILQRSRFFHQEVCVPGFYVLQQLGPAIDRDSEQTWWRYVGGCQVQLTYTGCYCMFVTVRGHLHLCRSCTNRKKKKSDENIIQDFNFSLRIPEQIPYFMCWIKTWCGKLSWTVSLRPEFIFCLIFLLKNEAFSFSHYRMQPSILWCMYMKILFVHLRISA